MKFKTTKEVYFYGFILFKLVGTDNALKATLV